MVRRTAIPLLCVALLAGCTYVPIRTMWAMRNFGPETLAQADPRALRAAVQVPDTVGLQPTGHALYFHAEIEGGQPPSFDVSASLEVEMSLRDSGPLEARPGSHWHVLKLDADGATAFSKVSEYLLRIPEETKGSFQLGVNPKFGDDDAIRRLQCAEVLGKFSIAMRLAPDQDWLVLVEDRPLGATPKEVKEQRAQAKAEGKPDPFGGADCTVAQ